MEDLLRIDDLRLTFETHDGPVSVLRGVDLTVGTGERVALVGESGSGKSVTARVIMGLLPQRRIRTSGNLQLDGSDVLKESPARAKGRRGRDITMIFQDPMAALNPVFTIRQQFAAVLTRLDRRLSTAEAESCMRTALRDVSIADPERVLDSYSFQLSGGLNQRVMIAMALASRPKLLIADEPGTALDVTVQQQTLNIMANLSQAYGTAILFISHNLGVVRKFADRVCVMYAGRIVESAPTDALFANPRHPYTRALLASVPRLSSDRLPEAIEGSVPDLTALTEGCAFRPRCQFSRPECEAPVPMWRHAGHGVACIHEVNPA
ncbi:MULTISPECIES: ABC transporter ATP-binding protein [Pseudomonadota]|uniref:Oligopeptide/dipeptide ABC transporter, ATPase subunit n=1 Tax=Chelativorans sp. (strain BNC1) TaxID=266779 RepID=Q11H74_CHESB|nr:MULTISPECIES: ABC transporter ATP-binding protein [Chelativorans]